MAILDRVTVSGADDSVDPGQVLELALRYPLAEVEIRAGCYQTGRPGYPSDRWFGDFCLLAEKERCDRGPQMRLAIRLGGAYLRQFMNDYCSPIPCENLWNRVHLGTDGDEVAVVLPRLWRNISIETCLKERQVVLQADGPNDDLVDWAIRAAGTRNVVGRRHDVGCLFNLEHEEGRKRSDWPPHHPGEYCGYARYLGPDNVVEELSKIEETMEAARSGGESGLATSQTISEPRYWIAGEAGLRRAGGHLFDLARAEDFVVLASKHAALSSKI